VYVCDVTNVQFLVVAITVGDDNTVIAVVAGDVAVNPPTVNGKNNRALAAGCRQLRAYEGM